MATRQRGLHPLRGKDGGRTTGGRLRFLIKNGYATAIGLGDPCKVSNGFIHVATNGENVVGTFAGCVYVESNTKQRVESNLWVASTSSGGLVEGQTHALGFLHPAGNQTFLGVFETSVSADAVGRLYPVSVGSANALTKQSNARIHASTATSAGTAMVRVLGFPDIGGTVPGDGAGAVAEVEFVNVGYINA